jgi:hypothetical protein
VTRIEISPAPNLYSVEFERHSGDLRVSIILAATCELMAVVEALRRFPEYLRFASRTDVILIDYAEIDWETGRCFVGKRQKKPVLPEFFADEPSPNQNENWLSGEGSAE